MLNFNSIVLMNKSGFGCKVDERKRDKRNKHSKETMKKAIAEWSTTRLIKATALKYKVPESTLKHWIKLDRAIGHE